MPADTSSKRLFIHDTNVLMHDPSALFKFQAVTYLPNRSGAEELDACRLFLEPFTDQFRKELSGNATRVFLPRKNSATGINRWRRPSNQEVIF